MCYPVWFFFFLFSNFLNVMSACFQGRSGRADHVATVPRRELIVQFRLFLQLFRRRFNQTVCVVRHCSRSQFCFRLECTCILFSMLLLKSHTLSFSLYLELYVFKWRKLKKTHMCTGRPCKLQKQRRSLDFLTLRSKHEPA